MRISTWRLGHYRSYYCHKIYFGIKLDKEEEELTKEEEENDSVKPHFMDIEVTNSYLEGKTLAQVHNFLNRDFVCSRILHEGHVSIPNGSTVFHIGDKLLLFVQKMMQRPLLHSLAR